MRLHLLALISVLAAGSTPLLAASFIPYPTVGSIAPATATFATGSTVSAYFYASSAADTDTISVFDITTGLFLSPTGQLNNQTSVQSGIPVVFSGSNAGDQIAFELSSAQLPAGTILSSYPSRSTDKVNHGYITPFSGLISKTDISGLYVGMEDLPQGLTDFDYNDDNFVVSGVTTTPEPSSFILLGTGLLGVAGAMRRKFTR